jgi:hypothetical protein
MNTAPRPLTRAYRNGRFWFCVYGTQCVATYPAAMKVLKEIRS